MNNQNRNFVSCYFHILWPTCEFVHLFCFFSCCHGCTVQILSKRKTLHLHTRFHPLSRTQDVIPATLSFLFRIIISFSLSLFFSPLPSLYRHVAIFPILEGEVGNHFVKLHFDTFHHVTSRDPYFPVFLLPPLFYPLHWFLDGPPNLLTVMCPRTQSLDKLTFSPLNIFNPLIISSVMWWL